MIGTSDGLAYEDESAYHFRSPMSTEEDNTATKKATEVSKPNPTVRHVHIIRHGTTALNSEDGGEDRVRGWKDVPLSDKGREEAEDVAHSLSDSGLEVLHHSDLSRATDTAKEVAKTTGATLVSNPKLRPWNVGHLTGASSTKAHGELKDYACNRPDEPIPGGESFREFKDRVFDGVQDAISDAGDKKLGIVTHHRVERLLNAWSAEGQPEDHTVHMNTFLQRGEPPGSAQIMPIRL